MTATSNGEVVRRLDDLKADLSNRLDKIDKKFDRLHEEYADAGTTELRLEILETAKRDKDEEDRNRGAQADRDRRTTRIAVACACLSPVVSVLLSRAVH